MLAYAADNPNRVKYGNLDRSGLIIQVNVGDTGEDLWLEGIRVSSPISEIQKEIQTKIGVHPSRQRLYAGGEEIKYNTSLLDYYSTSSDHFHNGCSLSLRCFIPLLMSSLECPGPMLTDIEVRPKNDEPVFEIKRRIRDKFRVEIEQQRLHLHPAEMVSFVRRRPLDDTRLFSNYLSPNCDGNFLELVVVKADPNTNFSTLKKEIYVRIPRKVTNLRNQNSEPQLLYSSSLHCEIGNEMKEEKLAEDENEHQTIQLDLLPPPPPPQTPESDTYREATPCEPAYSAVCQPTYEDWWLTVPIQTDQIIRRDPKIEDVRKILINLFKATPEIASQLLDSVSESNSNSIFSNDLMVLKFCSTKPITGKRNTSSNDAIYADLLLRYEEMLLCVAYRNLEVKLEVLPLMCKETKDATVAICYKGMFQSVQPLFPLKSYDERGTRCTAPPEPISLRWDVPISDNIDCGAQPGATFEFTGVSFARSYGSWDIQEHRKTYVEITLEGSFLVADMGLSALIKFDPETGVDRPDYDTHVLIAKRFAKPHCSESNQVNRIIYYLQDAIEVTILGPANPGSIGSKNRHLTKPFSTAYINQWANEKQKIYTSQQNIRRGAYSNSSVPKPPPLHMRIDERCVAKSLSLSDVVPSWEDRRQLSETEMGKWYVGREKVTDMSPKIVQGNGYSMGSSSGFASVCDRGVSIDGRPYILVTYKRLNPFTSDESMIHPKSVAADSLRKALDFRVQAQFYVCNPIQEQKTSLADAAGFTVRLRQRLIRVEHAPHTPDKLTELETPLSGLETTLNVALSTSEWRKSLGIEETPTIELQK